MGRFDQRTVSDGLGFGLGLLRSLGDDVLRHIALSGLLQYRLTQCIRSDATGQCLGRINRHAEAFGLGGDLGQLGELAAQSLLHLGSDGRFIERRRGLRWLRR